MRHEFTDTHCQGWVLSDEEPTVGAFAIHRDRPGAAYYAVDDPEEDNRSPILTEEIFRLAERERKLREALKWYVDDDLCDCGECDGPCVRCASAALLKEE